MGGLNAYQYCPNPVEWVDPLGLCCKENTWNEFQKQHQGQFANSSEASKAYQELKDQESPWPYGYTPPEATLLPGTKINMAMSPMQPSDRPGGFATFDKFSTKDYVYNELAVKKDWKPELDRVVTYEVTQPLPVKVGPVGPQIDEGINRYLVGGGTQVEMTVPPRDRMNYLTPVSEKPLKD